MKTNITSKELEARLTLHSLPKIGNKRFIQLINYFGSAEKALSNQNSWAKAGLPITCQQIAIKPTQQATYNTLNWLGHNNHHVVFWDSPQYPALLKETIDAPSTLFIQGNVSILETPQLTIVGSRHASKPGLDTTFQFARSLAAGGFTITSGLALGVDGAAHAGALAAKGHTIAVLGCGLNNIYPTSHKKLACNIVEQEGALISELPLDTAPQASNFPRRNRIISGLSLGTLVVEATLSSGSLITAKLAAEQGREVFAIPGSIHHPGAKGCHQLIRNGATLVENIDHILETLQGWKNINITNQPSLILEDTRPEPPDNLLLSTIQAAPLTSEALAITLNLPFEEVLIELTELELNGKITCETGLWYPR